MLGKNWRVALYFAMALMVLLPATMALADSDLTLTETAPDADGTTETSADEESEGAADSSTQASGAGISTALAKLSVHGYLTQAWATADFLDVPINPVTGEPVSPSPRREEISLGIPEDGTTNYRFLALQFRYDMSAKDVFVVQLSSRTLGNSPLQEFEDEVELDWAFYERRIGDNTSFKAGRIQIPLGIYNEVRDVGTILPFYRPAFIFYKEGAFTTETVDGFSISHHFLSDRNWSLEATLYTGEWESIFVDPFDFSVVRINRAEDGYGGQLWLNTPVSGLRFGSGYVTFDSVETGVKREFFHSSLDASFSRFVLQAEWILDEAPLIETETYYVLAGFNATENFRVWAQLEKGNVVIENAIFLNPIELDFREDLGISLNYFFSPGLVLKAEYHWVEEEDFFLAPDFSTGAFRLQPGTLPVPDGSYTIIALSVSF